MGNPPAAATAAATHQPLLVQLDIVKMFLKLFHLLGTGQLLVHVMPCCTIHYAS